MRQRACLPPDWRQLSSLRRLSLRCWQPVDWRPSLAALEQLTFLRTESYALGEEDSVSAVPASVCTLPALRTLSLHGRSWCGAGRGQLQFKLPPAFTSLTTLERLNVCRAPLTPESKALVEAEMPRVRMASSRLF